MAHYNNRSIASVGDVVKGWAFDTDHEIVGKIIGIESDGFEEYNVCIAHVDRETITIIPFDGPFDNPEGVVTLNVKISIGDLRAFERVG